MNYQPVTLVYDCEIITNILDSTEPKYCRPCSRTEINHIYRIFNFPFPIRSVLYFIQNSNSKSKIHKDINLDNKFDNPPFALNLPLSACNETFMRWYSAAEDADLNLHFGGPSSGARTPLLPEENAICIDTLRCDSPQFVNIQDWHSIENNSSIESKIISIRFHHTVSIDALIQKFKS